MKAAGNPNAVEVERAVKKLVSETLDKIIEGAKTASEAIGVEGNELIGNVAANDAGGVAATEVDKLINGIKSIVYQHQSSLLLIALAAAVLLHLCHFLSFHTTHQLSFV